MSITSTSSTKTSVANTSKARPAKGSTKAKNAKTPGGSTPSASAPRPAKKTTKKTAAGKRALQVVKRKPFEIADISVEPGTRGETSLNCGRLVNGLQLSMPVMILHGVEDGPTVWICAAVHGDEINGVEIIRRVVEQLEGEDILGTILVVPIVNVAGFDSGDRYLPDGRDLNRCFPGSAQGSLGGRVANVFMTEVVQRCSVGIDLHTGSDHRTNLPQIRANLDDSKTRALAEAFGTRVMIHSTARDGSLRDAGAKAGASVLLFEGGEAWRFDEDTIRSGVTGCLRVLHSLEMIDALNQTENLSLDPIELRKTTWIRARANGIVHLRVGPADSVTKGQTIGRLYNSFGHSVADVTSPSDGVVIGLSLDPTVNQGDAIVHVGAIDQAD